MLVSLIGLVTIFLVALVIGALKVEKCLWTSKWRFIFPGYREAAAMKGIADRLKVYSDGQDVSYSDLLSLKILRDKEYAELYHRVYDVDGLDAQVKDLKQVLEWTRTRCGELQTLNETAKREILSQIGQAHELRECLLVSESVRADQTKELRRRATTIRQLTERIQRYLLRGKVVGAIDRPRDNESLKSWSLRNPSGYASPVMKIRKKRQVLDTRKKK